MAATGSLYKTGFGWTLGLIVLFALPGAVFAQQTIEKYTSTAALNLNTGDVTSFSLDGITYTFNIANNNTVAPDGYLQGLPDETSADNSLVVDQDGLPGLTSVTISMTDGKAFKMSSFDIDILSDPPSFKIEPNGSTANAIVIPASGTSYVTQTVNLSGNSAFNSVTSITIAGGNPVINLGHLIYQEITPPVVTTSSGTTVFTGTPAVVDSGATIADIESSSISSATISMTNFHSGEDVLAFTNSNGAIYGSISGSYNPATGVLTLSGLGTLSQYQAAIDAVTYIDTSSTPNTTARTIAFSVYDGLASSNVATKTIDLSVPILAATLSGGDLYAHYGELLTYTIPLSNSGSASATNVAVDFGLTAGLDAANATWSCVASGGASCPATSGASMVIASLPVGGTLTWTLHVQVLVTTPDPTVTVQVSLNGSVKDSSTDTLVIFRNGFD